MVLTGRILPGKNGTFLTTAVAGEAVVTAWRRAFVKFTVDVEPVPFKPLSSAHASRFPSLARPYEGFLGIRQTVTVGAVPAPTGA